MACEDLDAIELRLTPSEAMTVLAAVRQYEPYWHGDDDAQTVATTLQAVRADVESVRAKIRAAAGGV